MFDILLNDIVVCVCNPDFVGTFVSRMGASLDGEYTIQVRKHKDPENKPEEDDTYDEDVAIDFYDEQDIDSLDKLEAMNSIIE